MTTEQTQHARDSAELRRLCSERDQLREKVAELEAGNESLRLVRDEYKRLADEYRAKWAAVVVAQAPVPTVEPAHSDDDATPSRDLRGLLLLVAKMMERDASEGKQVRGEVAAELRALLNGEQVRPMVPDGWSVEQGCSPSGYVLHSPGGSMIRVCDSGMGGIETAFAMFLKAMLAAAPSAGSQEQG